MATNLTPIDAHRRRLDSCRRNLRDVERFATTVRTEDQLARVIVDAACLVVDAVRFDARDHWEASELLSDAVAAWRRYHGA